MLFNRSSLRLAIGILVSLVSTAAHAQGLEGFQLFAGAEVTPYGGGPRPKEGYFFVFDGLYWSMSAPDVTTIGNGIPGQNSRTVYNVNPPVDAQGDPIGWTQTNSHGTGDLRAVFKSGNRFEIGRMVDRRGWMLGVYRLNSQTQRFMAADAHVIFADDDDWGNPSGGRLEGPIEMVPEDPNDPDSPLIVSDELFDLPVVFDDLKVINRLNHWSVELMYICRARHCHFGGIMELFAGARYMALDEKFNVEGTNDEYTAPTGDDDDDTPVPPTLSDSNWNTDAENHIIGPQVGARYFKKNGRWTFSTEGRFFAGVNYQNLRQNGVLGTKLAELRTGGRANLGLPAMMLPTNFEHSDHVLEFSPCAEVRAEWRFQATRSISLGAGWTGLWVGGIARASNIIDYSLREETVMGFLLENNRQDVFIHGLVLHVDVNR